MPMTRNQPIAGDKVTYSYFDTRIGRFGAASTQRGLCRLTFPTESMDELLAWVATHMSPEACVLDSSAHSGFWNQLEEYLAGERTAFDWPLDMRGTAFQQEVWAALRQIPYGEVGSYGDVAKMIGRPKAVRAVGAANGANPVPILVPCHRVIGCTGRLVGFGGGLELKQWLLELERRDRLPLHYDLLHMRGTHGAHQRTVIQQQSHLVPHLHRQG